MRLSLDEWEVIGNGFKRLEEDLTRQTARVGRRGLSRYADKIFKVNRRLDFIRTALEDEMYKDHPDAPRTIFYEEGS